MSMVVTYAGNGPFPFNLNSISPGSSTLTTQGLSPFSFAITLAETGGGPTTTFYSYANWSFQFSNPTCVGIPTPCSVGQVGLTPAATMTGPITVNFNPEPTITSSGVISASAFGRFPSAAPGSWIEIYGANLANLLSRTWATADFEGNRAPTALGGTSVTIAGRAAAVFFVTPGQINVQVPSGVPNGLQPLVVTTAGGSSAPYMININGTQPGLLAPVSFAIGGAQHVVALFSNTTRYVFPAPIPGLATARAKPGDSITLYGIGFGPVTPDLPGGQIIQQTNALQADFSITFADVPAVVNYAGLAPGFVGLYQFNVVVPNVAASDTVPVAFTLGGARGAQNLVIAVQN